jgi:hypothetical protein
MVRNKNSEVGARSHTLLFVRWPAHSSMPSWFVKPSFFLIFNNYKYNKCERQLKALPESIVHPLVFIGTP